MKFPAGYQIKSPSGGVLDSNGFSLSLPEAGGGLNIIDSTTGTGVRWLRFIIDPAQPIVVSPLGRNYELTLDGKDQYAPLSVLNWGTFYSAISRGPGQPDSLISGQVLFRNLKTGVVNTFGIARSSTQRESLLSLWIPATMEAGDYEMTLVRHNRRAVVPSRLSLKYGSPKITQFFNKSVLNHAGNQISYDGFNLLSSQSYEVELSSDFFPKQRFPLTPTSRFRIAAQLPVNLESGTYKAVLYLNGKEVVNENLLTTYNLISVHNEARQPALTLLTQTSSQHTFFGGSTFYEPSTTFKRSEPILALRTGPGMSVRDEASVHSNSLYLKNSETGAAFSLYQGGMTSGGMPYELYRIPNELPAGRYQVRFGIKYSDVSMEYISGQYYQEITVE